MRMLRGLEQQAVKRRPRTSFPRKISKETYKKQPLLRKISDLKSKRSWIPVKGPKSGTEKLNYFKKQSLLKYGYPVTYYSVLSFTDKPRGRSYSKTNK